jgi:hypothetical protein
MSADWGYQLDEPVTARLAGYTYTGRVVEQVTVGGGQGPTPAVVVEIYEPRAGQLVRVTVTPGVLRRVTGATR